MFLLFGKNKCIFAPHKILKLRIKIMRLHPLPPKGESDKHNILKQLTPLGVKLGSQACNWTKSDCMPGFVKYNAMHGARRRCVDWAQVRVAPSYSS